MTAEPQHEGLTWDEFLKFQQAYAGDERFELEDGAVVMMAGGTERHDLMAIAIFSQLQATFAGSPCRTFIHNRMIRTGERTGYYPDLLVRCGRGASALFENDARFVLEILSPANRPGDRTRRMYAYQALPSIEAVLFVDLERRVVTVHERSNGSWTERQVSDGKVELGPAVLDFATLWLEVDSQVTTE